MKVLLSTIVILAGVFAQQGVDFENDFFQGMENGFFLREDLQAYKEYECPGLEHNDAQQAKIN